MTVRSMLTLHARSERMLNSAKITGKNETT